MCSSRFEARGKFGEHERCIRVARGIAESNSSFLSALQTSKCFISRWTHSWHMNQLFYNMFNQMENFFSRGICLLTSWACTMGIWSTLANWIWLHKFTSYVIIEVNPLTPKIWFLILPSSCYTFPCKLVMRTWC